jgi:small subunit ribosomal protein S20
MANIKSAAKAARQAIKRTAINKSRLSRIRTQVRKVEEAILSGDQKAALAALKQAEPEIMRGATKGVVAKNAASRKVSRLTKRVKALGTK